MLIMISGLAVLLVGAEILVRGASRLASLLGISPLVIGLTVVAYGTSAPEMAVSALASRAGQADLALGNVVGSNICNVLLILGASALIVPLVVDQKLVRVEVPLMIGTSVLTLFFALDGVIGALEGTVLLVGAAAYTGFVIVQSRRESARIAEEYSREFGGISISAGPGQALRNGAFVLVGLGFLIFGSRWFVDGASDLARAIGVSELIIGLTVVAIGTSMPELVTSIVAAVRGERDIAVGNVVGSNIFNILAVLGLAALIAPKGIAVSPGILSFDIPVMIAVAVACLPIFFTGHRIDRWEGTVFLLYYVLFLTYLVLKATEHDSLPVFSAAMTWFAMPLTVLTVGITAWRAIRSRPTGSIP